MANYTSGLVFDDSSKVNTSPSSSLPSHPLPYEKPRDDFRPLNVSANTVFYLAVTVPQPAQHDLPPWPSDLLT